jgi:type IV pilus assembly protein PilA
MSIGRSPKLSILLKSCVLVPCLIAGLPSIFNRYSTACGCGPEAKYYIGSMNRAQQAYYLENRKFVTEQSNLDKLEIGTSSETKGYRYLLSKAENNTVVSIAVPEQPTLKSYVGIVWPSTSFNSEEPITKVILCQAEKPGMTGAPTGTSKSVEKQNSWSQLLLLPTHITQKFQPSLQTESPSFSQAISISSIHNENGELRGIHCPKGFNEIR